MAIDPTILDRFEAEVNATVQAFPVNVQINMAGKLSTLSFAETRSQLVDYVTMTERNLTLIRAEARRAFNRRVRKLERSDLASGMDTTLKQQVGAITKQTEVTIADTVASTIRDYKQLADELTPKCEYESKNLKANFLEAQDMTIDRLTELRGIVSRDQREIERKTQLYINNSLTLNEYAVRTKLSEQMNLVKAYTQAIENLVLQKIATVKRLIGHGEYLVKLSQRFVESADDNQDGAGGSAFGWDTIGTSQEIVRRLRKHVRGLEASSSTISCG